MNKDQVRGIEETLGITLPRHYKEWAEQLPLPGAERRKWHWAFNDPVHVIRINQELQRNGCYGEVWAPHLYVMADFDGNYVFLNTLRLEAGICYANHDLGPYYAVDNLDLCRYKHAGEFYDEPEAAL